MSLVILSRLRDTAPATGGVQVMGNPSFDTDSVWSKGEFNGTPVTISGGTANANPSGSGAAQIVGQSALTPGQLYNFSFDYKTGFNSFGKLRLNNSNVNGQNPVYVSPVLVGDGQWHTLTGSFTATDSWLWLEAEAALFDNSGQIDNFTATTPGASVEKIYKGVSTLANLLLGTKTEAQLYLGAGDLI